METVDGTFCYCNDLGKLIVEWYLRVFKQGKVRTAFGGEQFIEVRKEGSP